MTQSEQRTSPKIKYSPLLIPALIDNQTDFIAALDDIMQAADKRKYDDIRGALGYLEFELGVYLLSADTELYAYLYDRFPSEAITIRGFREKMTQVDTTVMGLIHQYDKNGFNDENIAQFLDEIGRLSDEFVVCIHNETTGLYPMYERFDLGLQASFNPGLQEAA